jgi:hypothetical protein
VSPISDALWIWLGVLFWAVVVVAGLAVLFLLVAAILWGIDFVLGRGLPWL